jgi:mono/diheme cytochrome c family protein
MNYFAPTRPVLCAFAMAVASLVMASGCRQRMSDQPYYRPYDPGPAEIFADGRSSRPLERGVIHRGQYLEIDPLVTGLTREEWGRAYALGVNPKLEPADQAKPENREIAIGSPRYDQRKANEPKVYVEDFPFAMTQEDLKRGQERFTIYCAVCHGPLGNGQGKIWERGYLEPTSFHTQKVGEHEKDVKSAQRLGFSRGYGIVWHIDIPLREAPVGYFYEVITRGYAGMPSYSAQIPPADRWRIIAYIRVLQLSQHADASMLSDDVKKRVEAGGKP